MKEELQAFEKTKDFLVCIDSDGCVLDTMDVKHMRCLGPCLVHVWGLGEFKDEILRLWRKVNLMGCGRGANRFSGLAAVLEDIQDNYMRVEGLDGYLDWVKNAEELSPQNLEKAYEKTGNVCMKKALEWSVLANQSMVMISDKRKQPFDGAEEALRIAEENADVVIVTAANGSEIRKEWEAFDIYKYTDLLMSQETGVKSECLKGLLEKGYMPDHVIMIGDAPADLEAAEAAGVLFYPVIAYQERKSWRMFPEVVERFIAGTYAGEYQDALITEFKKNLGID